VVAKNSCCPTFLIGLAGPCLAIMGAVFGTRAIVQRIDFGSRWLCRQRVISRNDVMKAARPLYALKLAIAELAQWYRTELEPMKRVVGRQPSFMFPHFMSFTGDNSEEIKFVYLKPESLLPSCTVFFAELELDKKGVVVKFLDTYNAEAHRYMAHHELAPKLIYCNALPGIGYEGRMMVIMEKVEGQFLFDLYHKSGKRIPSSLKGPIHDALGVLKQGGFIFLIFERQTSCSSIPLVRKTNFTKDACGSSTLIGYAVRIAELDIRFGCLRS